MSPSQRHLVGSGTRCSQGLLVGEHVRTPSVGWKLRGGDATDLCAVASAPAGAKPKALTRRLEAQTGSRLAAAGDRGYFLDGLVETSDA